MTHSSLALRTDQLIDALDLEPLAEGGYYRRTFESNSHALTDTARGSRFLMSSIYFLLTRNAPINCFHLNQSDIVHYYHLGDPIEYSLIFPDGRLKTVVMGDNIIVGECLQLHVPGGVWKASQLLDGSAGYGLISEAVSPGFDYADMTLGHRQALKEQFSEYAALIERLAVD
nr:cupin domain-containing protein [Pseudomonas sp. SJZ080]